MRARSLLATFGMLAIACTSKKKPPSDTPPAAAAEIRFVPPIPSCEPRGVQ